MVSSAGVGQSQESEANPALEYPVVSQAAHISMREKGKKRRLPIFARVRARKNVWLELLHAWRGARLDVMLIIKLSYARKRIVFCIFYIPLVAKKLYFI